MTQLRAVAIAAFFLGIGMSGEPFAPLHALLALALLLLFAVALEARASPLIIFLFALAGVLLTCDLQHGEIYPGTGIVGPPQPSPCSARLSALASSSYCSNA
jgi:hypothetical protein